MDAFLTSAAINVAIYGAIGYAIGWILNKRYPNLRPSSVSVGCLVIVLALPLLLGLGAWSAARSEDPFLLAAKEPAEFDFQVKNQSSAVGANHYVLARFRDEVFDGKDAFHRESYGDLVVVELMIRNSSSRTRELTKDDVDLRFDHQPIGASVIDADIALGHLRSFEEVVSGTGGTIGALPWELTCLFPLSLSLAPRDWVWVDNRIGLIRENAFDFGLIGPDEIRHGFVYFEAAETQLEWNDFLSSNQHRWGIEFTTRDQTGQVEAYSFDFDG